MKLRFFILITAKCFCKILSFLNIYHWPNLYHLKFKIFVKTKLGNLLFFKNILNILCLICIFSSKNISQINNNYFYLNNEPDSLKNNKWLAEFKSLSYFHNREYFGNITDGYTLFGNQITPKIIYKPHAKVSLEAGIFLRKDFGNEGIKEIKPIFTVVLKNDSTEFRFGNLQVQH